MPLLEAGSLGEGVQFNSIDKGDCIWTENYSYFLNW